MSEVSACKTLKKGKTNNSHDNEFLQKKNIIQLEVKKVLLEVKKVLGKMLNGICSTLDYWISEEILTYVCPGVVL